MGSINSLISLPSAVLYSLPHPCLLMRPCFRHKCKYDRSKNKHAFITELDQADITAGSGEGERHSLGLPFPKPLHCWTGHYVAYFGSIDMEHWDNRQ